MHARIEQLLSLRDGEPVDAVARSHIQQCAQCTAELTRLERTRERLSALASFDAPDRWEQIVAQAAQPIARRRGLSFAAAAAIVACVGLVVVVVRDSNRDVELVDQSASNSTVLPEAADAQTQKLMAQSRELDAMLQYLPERPQVERVALAATVDSIEERIQVLDWQLAYGADAGIDRQQAQRLWSERVDLMDSLVKVRYAESAPMTF